MNYICVFHLGVIVIEQRKGTKNSDVLCVYQISVYNDNKNHSHLSTNIKCVHQGTFLS